MTDSCTRPRQAAHTCMHTAAARLLASALAAAGADIDGDFYVAGAERQRVWRALTMERMEPAGRPHVKGLHSYTYA